MVCNQKSALRQGRLDSDRMELQEIPPGVIKLSSSVDADVWRERYKELQDWIKSMSGALPRLALQTKTREVRLGGSEDKREQELTDAGEFEQPLCT